MAVENPQRPEGLTPIDEGIISAMYDLDAIKFGDYKWKVHDRYPDAPRMPIYTNFRMLRREPAYKSLAVDRYQELSEGLRFDLIADIPTAASPFVASLSDRLDIGQVTPRMDKKGYGSGASVDGLMQSDEGKTVIMFDDLVSFFDSKIEAAEILRNNGLKVNDVAVLMHYQLVGPEIAASQDINVNYAFTAAQMIDFSFRSENISAQTHEQVHEKLYRAQRYFR